MTDPAGPQQVSERAWKGKSPCDVQIGANVHQLAGVE
jgi:hypothetical protein